MWKKASLFSHMVTICSRKELIANRAPLTNFLQREFSKTSNTYVF